ncbi:MAG: ATP-binding protein [Lachnospiraceae bacterium]|nr:ATP-binding protein [Lachnospiraceae bacterium]
MGLSNTQYRDIMFQYDQTRMQNQRLLDKRYQDIFAEIPKLESVQNEIMELSLAQARKELFLTEPDTEGEAEYHAKREALLGKKAKLLTEHGYPDDYLQSIYTCPDCHDTGYRGNTPCHCLKNAEIKALYESSNLMDVLESENFNTFDESFYDDTVVNENLSLTARQNILKVKDVCMDYIKHFDDSYDNLIFYGSTGVGKTFLTHCIAKQLLDSSHTVLYLTSLQLFDILEKNKFHHEDASTANEQIAYMLHSDLLIIDDLGVELVNSFTASQLYYFIEERHINKRSTVISTNLSFQELRERYSERIFSRFIGFYHFFMIIGDDIRQKTRLASRDK